MGITGRILIGNILFVVCCGFYIGWWVLRFRPANPVMGVRSGWLLMPAAIAGIVGVVLIIWGLWSLGSEGAFLPNKEIAVGWWFVLLFFGLITRFLLNRPVTTELTLITGWAALALAEVNAMYGAHIVSQTLAVVLIAVIAVFLIACLVCYVLYYRLDPRRGFIDGMIPLLLTGVFMAGVSIFLVV